MRLALASKRLVQVGAVIHLKVVVVSITNGWGRVALVIIIKINGLTGVEIQPLNAPTVTQQIVHALLTPNNPLRIACDREGVNTEKTAARMLHPSAALSAMHMK